ncbi:hypothetical protein [Lactimicrobium massiliense]|uniref:hypothetical protein n=1 Tax=Lactimicrobium massiliense TaxID=2161814 RepID=UPI000D55D173|nr:hypothetical protein [Lactimicrobium massiliense]
MDKDEKDTEIPNESSKNDLDSRTRTAAYDSLAASIANITNLSNSIQASIISPALQETLNSIQRQNLRFSEILTPVMDRLSITAATVSMEGISSALQSVVESTKPLQTAYMDSMASILRSFQPLSNLNTSLVTDAALQSFKLNIGSLIDTSAWKLEQESLAQTIAAQNQALLSSIAKITEIYQPFYTHLSEIGKSILSSYLNGLNQVLLSENWFPYIISLEDREFHKSLMNTLIHTNAGSKSREKRINRLIYDQYTKSRIESIRKSWRYCDLASFQIRILNQAVYAYHRGEYAITAIVLVSFWEGIIKDKTGHGNERQSIKAIRTESEELILNNDYPQIYAEFSTSCIFYDCNSVEEIKQDLPGRHQMAHSWFSQYPSKKTALNAILFTDFLIKMNAI